MKVIVVGNKTQECMIIKYVKQSNHTILSEC